ncbi:MAG: PD-(D/E)XK nuclease family protein [Candidatus Rokubacteria bacterium]|nr:PD-(D/E)XK nuclease family protein [Candidatus Rokubacteria bacterium]MBI3827651.1 PD-(D/E)XK nuclease family protein [Candidatus Rokubacteria bacterium]
MHAYSHTRLSVYETCPRQYHFQYVEHVKAPEIETVEMFLGSRVHQTLEGLYHLVRFGRVPTLDTVLSAFRRGWDEAWHDDIRVTRPGLVAEDYRRLGERQLEDYHRRYAPFTAEHTLAVERRLLFPLDAGETIWFQGIVDRLTRARDGRWEIRDYKTGGWLPDQAQLDRDRQLALYELGVRHRWPSAESIELVWHYLAHDLELRSRRSPEALEALRQETIGLVRTIEGDRELATRVGAHCGRCPFQPICPAWRHQAMITAEVAALPEAARADDEPVRWVDRLGELTAQQAAIEAEIDDLGSRVAAFAAAGGLDRVFGVEYVTTVKRTERVAYPRKTDPQRPALEALLRDHGVWEAVATLDTRALAARAADAAWPAALRGAVMAMARRESSVSLSTRRLPSAPER